MVARVGVALLVFMALLCCVSVGRYLGLRAAAHISSPTAGTCLDRVAAQGELIKQLEIQRDLLWDVAPPHIQAIRPKKCEAKW